MKSPRHAERKSEILQRIIKAEDALAERFDLQQLTLAQRVVTGPDAQTRELLRLEAYAVWLEKLEMITAALKDFLVPVSVVPASDLVLDGDAITGSHYDDDHAQGA
jgi:hypothetical protein